METVEGKGYRLIFGDCLEAMRTMPDKSIDLVLTDPPYGIADIWKGGASGGWGVARLATPKRNAWDTKPARVYFDEILRVGKKVIIWGGNYFELPISRGWLVWNKPERGFTLAEAELAWTNLDIPIRVFDCHRSDTGRFHPTQKPESLMTWCIAEIAKITTGTVFDPYSGSFTSGAAAMKTGLNFIGCEVEKEYFDKGVERIELAAAQPLLPGM